MVPDLLATAKVAVERSIVFNALLIVAGLTVSNTFSFGTVSGKTVLNTSGVRLLPPIPKTLNDVILSNASRRARFANPMPEPKESGRSSQPIQSPPPPGDGSGQMEQSRAQIRRTMSAMPILLSEVDVKSRSRIWG